MVTPLDRYRDKLKRDADKEESKRRRSPVSEWFSSPLINWFVTVVVIGAVSFYYTHHRSCIEQNQTTVAKSEELIEDIRARLSVTYVFYQNADSMSEFVEERKRGADVQNAALGTSTLFYLYRQLIREERDYVDGGIVDEYVSAASRVIFPSKPFREAMSDAAVLLSTDVLPKELDENSSFAQIKDLAFRSIQLMLFQVNFIEQQLKPQSCSPSSILRDAFLGERFVPVILPPTQLPPAGELTQADVYAVAPVPELAAAPVKTQ